MQQNFDAIIIGAGPAGCACGYKLAKAGLQVLVMERGKFAGAKNMWGGAFCGPVLSELIPDFYKEAPYERYVAAHKISLVNKQDCVTIDSRSRESGQPPFQEVIFLRSKFDRWLADKVQEAGAIVASGLEADDLLWNGKQVIGVKAGGDELPASVVIACDGVNSTIARKAGLKTELTPSQVKQGVKEILTFPRKTIEDRFGLTGDEGASWSFLGQSTGGLPGGGFIYTNKDSLSVGIVVQLSALMENRVRAEELLEDFKKLPVVARLIQGGILAEYSAHLIPTAGISMMPKLFSGGFLVAGDAAALVVGTGLILEGANFAAASGIAAAEAVIQAKTRGDFSASSLASYQEILQQSFVLKDLKTFCKAPHFLENPRIYSTYPELICSMAQKLFSSDGKPRKRSWQVFRDTMRNKTSLWQIARDLWRGRDAL